MAIKENLDVIIEENNEENIIENQDGDADSGVDETTQAKDGQNVKKPSRIPKKTPPGSPQKRSRQLNPLDSRRMPRSKSVPKPPFTTFSTPPSSSESNKKVPMNKIVVGHSPSPNLKKVQSKVGSLSNATHKPGGGQVKIENRKLDWNTTSRTKNMNDGYIPGGGDKKIEQKKLSWNAAPKVGSLNNAAHKPGGGTKKIENRKLEWNAGSKVGSTNNIKHKPGGGNVQDLAARVARKRSTYVRAWAEPLKPIRKKEKEEDKEEDSDKENPIDDSPQHSEQAEQDDGEENEDNRSDKDDKDEDDNTSEKDKDEDETKEDDDKDDISSHSPTAPPAELVQDLEGSDSSEEDREVKIIDENSVKVFIRGKPVILHIPKSIQSTYSLEDSVEAPDISPSIKWVYGCRGKDTRSNLWSLPGTGEILYYTASIAVLYSPESHVQRHYRGHTDDIECITVHPQLPLVASGQAAGHDDQEVDGSHVQVWNYETLNLIHILGIGEFENKVTCLAFSVLSAEGESKLAVVDGADQPRISVWTSFDKPQIPPRLMMSSVASSEKVLSVKFYEKRLNILVTCGKTHLNIWSIEGDILMRRQGLFTKKIEKPKYVVCVAFASTGEILTGDTEGNVMVWRSTKVIRVLKGAHTGPVSDICVLEDGSFISGGVSDGALCVFSSDYSLIGVGATLPEQFGGVRRIIKKSFKKAEGVRTLHLLMATTTNSIVEAIFRIVEESTEIQDWEVERLVLGHYQEVWGLAPHPTRDVFMTAGYDGNVILWDAVAHVDLWVVHINGQARCVDISPDGEAYAVGTMGGVLHVAKMETKEHAVQKHSESIETIKFSPSGEYLAVGCHDMIIHIYKFTENYDNNLKVSECKGHSSYIKSLDWSTDSKYIRSNSGDHELLFWEASTGDQQTDLDQLSQKDWKTQSCAITFDTIGIWHDRQMDGTDINCCARSEASDADILAVGDDFGKVRLYRYPARQPRCSSTDLIGHSAHVTNVAFPLTRSIVSTGGREASVIQWEMQ